MYSVCLISNQTFNNIWFHCEICPLNWLQWKVEIDWALVNWPQSLVPQAFRQETSLSNWCLIRGPRWRHNCQAAKSLTHTFTRRVSCSGCPRGINGSEWPHLLCKVNIIRESNLILRALCWMERWCLWDGHKNIYNDPKWGVGQQWMARWSSQSIFSQQNSQECQVEALSIFTVTPLVTFL